MPTPPVTPSAPPHPGPLPQETGVIYQCVLLDSAGSGVIAQICDLLDQSPEIVRCNPARSTKSRPGMRLAVALQLPFLLLRADPIVARHEVLRLAVHQATGATPGRGR